MAGCLVDKVSGLFLVSVIQSLPFPVNIWQSR